MKFDIMPINSSYSGIDRSLTTDDFLTKKTKPYFKTLLSLYLAYLDLTCSPHTALQYDYETFCTIQSYYKQFCEYQVPCEMIVYDNTPISDIFGYNVKFLGIDIVHDMAESLLNNTDCLNVDKRLNEFGLYSVPIDITSIADDVCLGHNIWKPCWVYKVLF